MATETVTAHPARALLGRMKHGRYLPEADMASVREYLAACGAKLVESRASTQSWCYNKYNADFGIERWVGPNHNLKFRLSGPNAATQEPNGWSAAPRSECPEWVLDEVAVRLGQFCRCAVAVEAASAELAQVRERVALCCGGENPKHSASCGWAVEDKLRRLQQACRSARRWASMAPPNDLGSPEVAAAIAAAKEEISGIMPEIGEAEAYAG